MKRVIAAAVLWGLCAGMLSTISGLTFLQDVIIATAGGLIVGVIAVRG